MDVEQRKKLCKQIIKGIEDILCGFRELSNIIDSDMDIEDLDVIHTEKENVEIEVIRGVMAEKAREGKAEQVRELLKLFNAEKLSDVHEDYYDELFKLAQNL